MHFQDIIQYRIPRTSPTWKRESPAKLSNCSEFWPKLARNFTYMVLWVWRAVCTLCQNKPNQISKASQITHYWTRLSNLVHLQDIIPCHAPCTPPTEWKKWGEISKILQNIGPDWPEISSARYCECGAPFAIILHQSNPKELLKVS